MNLRQLVRHASRLHVSITNPVEAKRIRAVSVMSLFLGIATFLFVSFGATLGIIASKIMFMAMTLASAICFGVYGLLRSKFYKYGVWIFLIITMAMIHLRPLNSNLDADRIIAAMAFVPAIQTMGLLVLSRRGALLFLAANFALTLLAFVIRPDLIGPPGFIVAFILGVQTILFVIFSDVSDMERDLAEKAAANEAVAEIMAGIAHGINSPLAATKALSARLMRKTKSDGIVKIEDVNNLISKLDSSVDRTLIISKGLQFFVEPPSSFLSDEFFKLTDVCRDALDLCLHAFYIDHVNVIFDVNAADDILVKGSKDRVTHAIVNVMSPAFKAFSTGISSTIHLTIEAGVDRIILKVGDSTAQDLEKLRNILANQGVEEGAIERGDDIELRMARRLFERCGATLDVGKDPAHDKFRIAFTRHS